MEYDVIGFNKGNILERESEIFRTAIFRYYPNFDGLPDDNNLREWKMKAGILDTIDEIEEEVDEDEDEDLIIM